MKRILVAEDNPASRELIREILEPGGYQVVEARDGQETLQKIEEVVPDLVLLDIQMPVVDGFAVLRQLRQDARFTRLPVLAVTAFAMRGDQEKVLAAGFDGYLTKPINPAQLRARIEEFLR